ncbi:peptidylprolyl isomerase [Craterilacuibacter sp.]|uniref:peptidylprolyl isomerase n=1 Tax=Craterilacuibacter sp. TaxID=2870909 RepID=UPI003F2DF659
MPIVVNGVELTDSEIEQALPDYQDSINPVHEATTAWVLQRVLLDEAAHQSLSLDEPEAAIEALLQQQVKVPEADAESCRRHYEQHPARFTVGEIVEADHILFQVTPDVKLDALTALAESVLSEVLADPACFTGKARALSNCSSGQLGGNLGQLSRGESVPEFERVVFAMAEGETLNRLLQTRFGLHIVRVVHKEPGRLLPFSAVEAQIAGVLHAASLDAATRQYLKRLVGEASISGFDLKGTDSPLVQ